MTLCLVPMYSSSRSHFRKETTPAPAVGSTQGGILRHRVHTVNTSTPKAQQGTFYPFSFALALSTTKSAFTTTKKLIPPVKRCCGTVSQHHVLRSPSTLEHLLLGRGAEDGAAAIVGCPLPN